MTCVALIGPQFYTWATCKNSVNDSKYPGTSSNVAMLETMYRRKGIRVKGLVTQGWNLVCLGQLTTNTVLLVSLPLGFPFLY